MPSNHQKQSPPIRYGLDNPHPLSQLKTELVWDGKYDEYGNRREVDIAGCAMPLFLAGMRHSDRACVMVRTAHGRTLEPLMNR